MERKLYLRLPIAAAILLSSAWPSLAVLTEGSIGEIGTKTVIPLVMPGLQFYKVDSGINGIEQIKNIDVSALKTIPALPFTAVTRTNTNAALPAQQKLIHAAAQTAAPSRDSSEEAKRANKFNTLFDGKDSPKKDSDEGVSSGWVQGMIAKDQASSTENNRIKDVVQLLGFKNAALNADIIAKHNPNYTVELSRGPITDQKSSGRCWIFAGLNMVRSMMKTPENTELSENYLHFFNMLEKSVSYIDNVINKTYTSPSKAEKLGASHRDAVAPKIDDGGWYQYFSFLVSKYGLAPKSVMPETASSGQTAVLLKELNMSLASTAEEMNENAKRYKAGKATDESRQIKETGMARVWKILSTHLGTPPQRFDYRESDNSAKDGNIKTTPARITSMTPLDFAQNVAKFDPTDYVSITSYPGKKKATVYEIKKSVMGALPKFDFRFLNTTSQRLEELAATAIKGGQPIWFGADVLQDMDPTSGIMHPQIFDRASVYQFSPNEEVPGLSRKEAFYFKQIEENHAMLLTGYDQPDPKGPIVKFKVENSWGAKVGSQGIFHLYHDWFLKNVFEVVIHKIFLSDAETALWNGKAKQTNDTSLLTMPKGPRQG